ncbi:MAG: metallophosphoesterase family protein [Candidatus Omnitrophica bacterium]|nr:metallophosphoesterase family protein [Candidatus Omnitrophota bacterium]
MIYVLFSDCHGNLEALTAVVEAARAYKPDRWLFMGDVVGYGANPRECLELVRSLNPVWVAGNHDWAAGGRLDFEWFRPAARAAMHWTCGILSDAEKEVLRGMPLKNKEGPWTLVHGGPGPLEEFQYCLDAGDCMRALLDVGTPFLAVGHSHIPMVGVQDPLGRVSFWQAAEGKLNPSLKTLVNPGSVGQPRDSIREASFAVFDDKDLSLKFRRVDYEVEQAAEKILRAGLPHFLAERLKAGC